MLFEICLLFQTAEFFLLPPTQLVDENKENFKAQFKTQKNAV